MIVAVASIDPALLRGIVDTECAVEAALEELFGWPEGVVDELAYLATARMLEEGSS